MKDLLTELMEYSKNGKYPMHMPGHKRNVPAMPDPYSIDITEIEGFDNLHCAQGILKEGMARTAKLFGSRHSFHLVNGSTVGILSAILAATSRGDEVLIARNCHKAVYHALLLGGLKPIYMLPPFTQEFSINGSILPRQVQAALEEHPAIKLVVITSPTYEGVVSNIPAIAALCHDKGIPLFVDEAHGAHFGFHPDFPDSAAHQGADLVVQSFHKTLPSLTQTAVLHCCSDRIPVATVQKKLEVLETSSPSYVLMASMERCVSLVQENQKVWFTLWAQRLSEFYQKMESLQKLRLIGDTKTDTSAFFGIDRSKLVVSTKHTNFTGEQLADFLRQQEKIEPEMISANYVVYLTTLCDAQEGYDRLARGLIAADQAAQVQQKMEVWDKPVLPIQVLLPSEVEELDGQFISIRQSAGCITKEFISAYPPGIPIAVPGEKLLPQTIRYVENLVASGVSVQIGGREDSQVEVALQKAEN